MSSTKGKITSLLQIGNILHRDQPWECEGLDPFRDDPVGTDSDFEYNDIDGDKSDDKNGEDGDQGAPCTCGNCVHMPSLEERLCCKGLLGWQKEYKSTGVKDKSCLTI